MKKSLLLSSRKQTNTGSTLPATPKSSSHPVLTYEKLFQNCQQDATIKLQLQLIQENKNLLLERISNTSSNINEFSEIEDLVLSIIESLDNILKLMQKADTSENLTPRSKQNNRNSHSPFYWRSEYTEIYQKWDYQNRVISRLQTQIQQLERDNKQSKPSTYKDSKEFNKLKTLSKKQSDILQLEEQQNQLLRFELISNQKTIEELNQIIQQLTLKAAEDKNELSYQLKESQNQIDSLTSILQEQEKEIEKLNEENMRHSEELKIMNIKENQKSLTRMSRLSNQLKSQTPQLATKLSFTEAFDNLVQNRMKSFSFNNNQGLQVVRNHIETTSEEDDVEINNSHKYTLCNNQDQSCQTEFNENTIQQENSQLKEKLFKLKSQYEKRIEELELQHTESDSEAPSDIESELKSQLEQLKQDFELQMIELKNSQEATNVWRDRYYMQKEDFLSRLANFQTTRNFDELRIASQSLIQNDDEEVKKLEQSMKTNMKRMLMMKEKMIKLKTNLEDYGEKIGIINGRNRNSIEFTEQPSKHDQQLQISELIMEFLKAIDSMNEVQRQIQDDYDRRIQKENDKQIKLVQQNLQLKSDLRQQKLQFEQSIIDKKKLTDLEKENQKLKLDNHNLHELLQRSQKENGKSLKVPDEAEMSMRLNARSSTISVQNVFFEKQEQEIKMLKKEVQEGQDLINKLYKQLSSQQPEMAVGRVSMIGQGFETAVNDKQTQYLSKRVADLQRKLDAKQVELLQETQRSQQLRVEYEEIVSSLEEEIRLRDLRLQELHQQLLEASN